MNNHYKAMNNHFNEINNQNNEHLVKIILKYNYFT